MVNINIRTNAVRKTVSAEITDTPKNVFDAAEVDTSSSMINLNGVLLHAGDVVKSFAELGVEDGGTAYLNAIVKADGASN